jgi:hypothetical protein
MRSPYLTLALTALLLVSFECAFAQKKKKANPEEPELDERISTRMSSEKYQIKGKTASKTQLSRQKSTKGKTSVKAIEPKNKFVEAKTWKRQVAYEEAKEDPTYGDPMYFGHKKKPKKNPKGKRKLCKECKMVH